MLPPLPAPTLPDRVLGLLRTPPESPVPHEDGAAQYGGSQWGSPYPPHLRSQSSSSQSLSSEASEDAPIHRLELPTPFLRPAPLVQESSQPEVRLPGISAAATVLANRARRLAHGITEGWIRQHTARGSDQEKRHWFSDGTGDSENSSLSDSFSGEEAAWLDPDEVRTPRARRKKNSARSRQTSRGDLWKQSSSETLRQGHFDSKKGLLGAKMASSDERGTPDLIGDHASAVEPAAQESTPGADRPSTPTGNRDAGLNGQPGIPNTQKELPATPRSAAKKAQNTTTPRIKKRVPWKGKSVMVLLPRDDERGALGKANIPLKQSAVTGMLRSWEELGYNIDGFDLYSPTEDFNPSEQSQSRGAWPDPTDLALERNQRSWKVLLPDLNGT